MEASAEAALPAGVVTEGTIRDQQKCTEVIRMLLAPLPPKTRRAGVVLCLPPEKVYTQRISLPLGSGHGTATVLPNDVARLFPEEAEDLAIVAQVLDRTKEEKVVGVGTVRNDVLRGYLEVLAQIPLEVIAITTVPTALAHVSPISRECHSFLLVLHGAGVPQTLTLFEHRFPTDEAVLEPKASEEILLTSVREMLREYRASGRQIECIVVQADPAVREKLLELCTREGLQMRDALPELGVVERKWVGSIAASLAGEHALPLDFALGKAVKWHELFVLGALGIALAVGVLWYFL